MITKMVKMSFPLSKRALASSISSLAIPLGGVIGVFFSSFFCTLYTEQPTDITDFTPYQQQIYNLNTADLSIAIFSILITIFCFKELKDYNDKSDEDLFSFKIFLTECWKLCRNKH